MANENMAHILYGVLLSCKKNQTMDFTGKWLELEKIKVREVTQTQKGKHCMYSVIRGA
jgi:hypothetical protein